MPWPSVRSVVFPSCIRRRLAARGQLLRAGQGPRGLRRSFPAQLVAVALLSTASVPGLAQATKADLARARTLYNERQFDQAIEAARLAGDTPETRDAAAVVLARALLERYRERVDPADLGAAREALGGVRAMLLEDRERVEYLLALGQALFLEDEFGAAAIVFESGVEKARLADPDLGDAMVDWWGSAAERQADGQSRSQRMALFTVLAAGMAEQLQRAPDSSSAAYWLAAARRGAGDPLAAWHAAVAGWVRARLAGERAASLRADLDKLMIQGIIPDRVKDLAESDRPAAESQLRAEWELVKERWK